MSYDIKHLFQQVADLSIADREEYFQKNNVDPVLRAEVESLCGFDSQSDSLTNYVAETAADLMKRDFDLREGAICGSYRLTRLLGRGGMGAVYLAERQDGEVDRTAAVKVIRQGLGGGEVGGRFLRERQILASLHHGGIARLFDAGHSGAGNPYLVMEYVEGIPLDEYAVGLELREKLRLFLQVCAAVSYAHGKLVIHRDLKPANILVDASGQAKLLDFGIARILEDGGGAETVERRLTPDFASPEQVRGNSQSTATDIYSLGAVFYHMLTGRSPHAVENSESASVDNIICSVVPPPASEINPALPRDLDFILARALRKEPDERYPNVDALAADIQAFLDHRPVRARSGNKWYVARTFLRRHWLPVSAIFVAMVFLAAGMIVANTQRIIAERRFGQLRQLADELLNLDSELYALPGATKVREQVVAAGTRYLAGLRSEAANDADLSLDLAKGYVKLAHAQGVPAYPNLGHYSEAVHSLRSAESLAEGAMRRRANRDALLVAAEANQDQMIVADTLHQGDEALKQARLCAVLVNRVISDRKANNDDLKRSSHLLANVALGFMNLHQFGDAAREAKRQVELARSSGAPPDYVTGGLGVLANALRQSGDLDGALQSISEARRLAEVTTFPNDVARASVMYAVLLRQGMILGHNNSVSLGRPTEAAACFQQAFDIVNGLAARDPNDATSRDRAATAGRELGKVLVRVDPARALAVYESSLARLRETKRAVQGPRDEALTLALSSAALRNLGRTREAGERIDAAMRTLQLNHDLPTTRTSLGSEVEETMAARADWIGASGSPGKAIELYQELLNLILASKLDPANDLPQAAGLSAIYLRVEQLARAASREDEAQIWHEKRISLWKAWAGKLPGNRFVARQLSLRDESSAY